MKKFEIVYTDICYVIIEASSEKEAMEKFEGRDYDPSTRTVEGFQDASVNREI